MIQLLKPATVHTQHKDISLFIKYHIILMIPFKRKKEKKKPITMEPL